MESPILNIRLKNVSNETYSDVIIGYIGTNIRLNYPYIHLGLGSKAVCRIYYGQTQYCYHMIGKQTILLSGDSIALDTSKSLKQLPGIDTHHISLYSGDIGILDVCAIRSYAVRARDTYIHNCHFLHLCGADFRNTRNRSARYVVYQGHHYEYNATYSADLIPPSTSFVEHEGLYINCQGRAQLSLPAVSIAGSS
jgi:NADH dehydrogenase/NADH:ubiquinone oxidoreductase subunit G